MSQFPLPLVAALAAFQAALAVAAPAPSPSQAPVNTKPCYLFSYFRGNGEDGLHLAFSRDGYRWTALNNDRPFLAPRIGDKECLMRDPCLRRGPGGTFHLVWTVGWNEPRACGYASSTDLVHWSEQRAIPVMAHEPQTRNVWAPELFYDDATQQWLLFWSSTIPGRFPETEASGDKGWNHRIYFCTTKDFATFSPTRLFFDAGFNVIDATLLQAGGRYHLIMKDETKTPVKKHLRLATSDHAEGPFTDVSEPFTIDWVEGPSAIQLGADYIVYFDHYAKPQYYGAVRSRDLRQWQDISEEVAFPAGARHGTAIEIPEAILQRLPGSR